MAIPRSRDERETRSFMESSANPPTGSRGSRFAVPPLPGYAQGLGNLEGHARLFATQASHLLRPVIAQVVELPALDEAIEWIDAYPFDAERAHPLAKRLRPTMETHPTSVAQLVREIMTSTSDVAVLEDLLRIVGTLPLAPAWDAFAPLFQRGLEHASLRVRGAAVHALERLAVEPGSVLRERAFGLLRAHEEPEAWLRDYIRRVVV